MSGYFNTSKRTMKSTRKKTTIMTADRDTTDHKNNCGIFAVKIINSLPKNYERLSPNLTLDIGLSDQ